MTATVYGLYTKQMARIYRTINTSLLALTLWVIPGDIFAQGSGSIPVQFTSSTVGPSPVSAPDSVSGKRDITLNTPVGPIQLRVGHVGAPSATPQGHSSPVTFRPPSIFSAPLPTGSGARALGLGGSFTAIADDATAASWNPAGLINLEKPEASIVFRSSFTQNKHHSSGPDYRAGTDRYESGGVNYLSLAYPLYFEPAQRNVVLSLNIQEAYDFENHFSAQTSEQYTQRFDQSNKGQFTESQTDVFSFDSGRFDLQLTSTFTTDSETRLEQKISTKVETDINFDQEGIIDALTPAIALEITPKFSLGAALNYYFDSSLPGQKIQSTTVSRYTAETTEKRTITQHQRTSGSYALNGTFNSAGIPPALPPFSTPIPSVSGNYPSFEDQTRRTHTQTYITDGVYTEKNEFDELNGINATLGALWNVNNFLVLGASTDLAWSAEAKQKKTIRHTTETYNADRSRLLNQSESRSEELREVTFHFPLYWSLGAALRWSPHFYTAIDVSHTRWSEFAYEVEGEAKINPFDGSPHAHNKLDDTWSVRVGSEYLKITQKGEIPFRGGLIYEERPALGKPDQYYGFALGSGYAIDLKAQRLVIDLAYHFMVGNDVQSVVPDQQSLSSDVILQQLFLSGIWHF